MGEFKTIHVTINDDGTTSNGSIFSAVDDENFYLDYIKYTMKEGHLVVEGFAPASDYDRTNFDGTVNIVSSITYKGNTYEVTTIRAYAFAGCGNLTSVTIPDSVTSIDEMVFAGCSSLTSITIPDSVTSIGKYAFSHCSSLTSINIPNGVTKIEESTFWKCASLTSVNIPEGVKKIGRDAFLNCTSLTSITIPKSVRKIEDYAFDGCSSLTSIDIPKSVKNIEKNAFSGCTSLTSIDLPGVTSIGEEAFRNCTSLTSITLPKSTKKIERDAFKGCSSLASITISEGNPVYDSRENCNAIIETASNTLIAGCQGTIIPKSVTSIGNRAFEDCSSLTSINIPESVTSIGEYAFYDCPALTSITVSEGNPVYDSRENCNAIIETASNTLIAGCQGTIIPKSVTSIGHGAFWGCSSLTSIVIPESVTSIGSFAFIRCSSLTSINIPNGITSIGFSVFERCSSLTSIVIPNSVTSIDIDAFEDCSSLTSINIPESVTSIGGSAFRGCSSLTTVICRAVGRVHRGTLKAGPNITIVHRNGSTEKMKIKELHTFEGMGHRVTTPELGSDVFSDVPQSEATLYVPASALEAYKAAGQWNRFGTILPIEG